MVTQLAAHLIAPEVSCALVAVMFSMLPILKRFLFKLRGWRGATKGGFPNSASSTQSMVNVEEEHVFIENAFEEKETRMLS